MHSAITEKTLARLLSVGAFLITVFIWMSGVTDPVNATKLALLGGLGIASLGLTLIFLRSRIFPDLKTHLCILVLLNLTMLNAVLNSKSPLTQNIYGVFGRNTGALTYVLLSAITLACLVLRTRDSFRRVVLGFIAAGSVNAVYSLWVMAFGDFVSWDNPYKKVLGTFGNPDFVSAFLGMFFAVLVTLVLVPKMDSKWRLLLLAASILVLVEIRQSHAIQGLVVAASGTALTVLFALHARYKNWKITSAFAISVFLLGLAAIAGALQKGPFTFLYKKSVSLRGSYWETAWDMGNSRPLTGVGLDSYIDSYRRFRPARALVDTPAINVTSNASHNVFLDFFASGGYPLAIMYVLFTLTGVLAIIKQLRKKLEFDWIFVSMSVAWAGYQVQSIVSINQIGLAIWGWIFTGTLVAYSLNTNHGENHFSAKPSKKLLIQSSGNFFSPQLVAGIGIVLGVLVASAPLSADSKWFTAISTKSYSNFEKSLTPAFYNPQTSMKYGQAINLIQNSQLLDQSYLYAKAAVAFNPEFFEAWKQLYYQPKASPEEKNRALTRMKFLDPLNPDPASNQ